MNAKPSLLVHPPLPMFEYQLAAAYDVVHWPPGNEKTRTDISAAAVVGGVGLTNAMIDALPALKTIVGLGAGLDGLDLAYCRARGIAVTNWREVNHEDVADVALGLIIAVVRGFGDGARVIREGDWKPPLAIPPRRRLRGMKLGIVGMGAIGQAIAARAAPCGLDIAWTGPRAKPELAYRYEPDLLALARWADILTVAPRSDKSTNGLIDAAVIEALGGDGVLINVSRGATVDEDAMIAALKSGKLGGAGLDVFVEEPTPPERWAAVPNVFLVPHLGGLTREALMAGTVNTLENLRRHFAGEELLTPVD